MKFSPFVSAVVAFVNLMFVADVLAEECAKRNGLESGVVYSSDFYTRGSNMSDEDWREFAEDVQDSYGSKFHPVTLDLTGEDGRIHIRVFQSRIAARLGISPAPYSFFFDGSVSVYRAILDHQVVDMGEDDPFECSAFDADSLDQSEDPQDSTDNDDDNDNNSSSSGGVTSGSSGGLSSFLVEAYTQGGYGRCSGCSGSYHEVLVLQWVSARGIGGGSGAHGRHYR